MENCKCNLRFKKLSAIDINLLPQIRHFFLFTKFDASDVIYITTSGDVYGFGTNKFGRLGLGNDNEVSDPTLIPELCGKDVMDIQFGQQFMVALTQAMEVYVCGYEYSGMLGTGSNSRNYVKPQQICCADKLVVEIKCCATSTYLLMDNKEIYYFGYRNGITSSPSVPTLTPGLNNLQITGITCGWDHTLALTNTGIVFSWGLNNYGQLGSGNTTYLVEPEVIQMPENVFVKQISCGNYHSLLLTTDGQIYSFGANSCGQLGTADNTSHLVPKLVESKNKFTQIYAFEDISMAMNERNEITVWGKPTISSPFTTTMSSFQEAINTMTRNPFTYKPIAFKDLFTDKKVNRMTKTMAKAFNNPKNSDLKFKLKRKGSENKFGLIYVHKWFIEENSEYFERMFANDWSESDSEEIEINGYSYEAYYQYIRCLYTNCIETEDIELLIEIMSITDEYLNEETKSECIRIIKPLLSIKNVCSLYCCSLKNRSKDLEDYCFGFMSRNIDSVAKTKDYEQMDDTYAKHFLTQFSQNK